MSYAFISYLTIKCLIICILLFKSFWNSNFLKFYRVPMKSKWVTPNWFNYISISWIRVKFQSIIVLNFKKPILKILLVKITFTHLKEHLLQSWRYGVDLCIKQKNCRSFLVPFKQEHWVRMEIQKEFKGLFWLFGCKYNF